MSREVGGNSRAPARDLPTMGSLDCAACREELSAELDGEGDPACRPAVLAHLEDCAACTGWRERAAVVTRLTRTAPAEAAPDLVARVLPAAPRPRRWRLGARLALVAVGVAQIVLGALSVVGATGHGGAAMLGGADMAHMSHETAAWNLALGAAFLAGAWWTRHLAGLLPVLGAFIVVLGVLSGLDLAAGRVEPDRVATHALLLVGFALTVLVARSGPARGPGPAPYAAGSEEHHEVARTPSVPAPARRDHLGPVAHDRPGRREVA